ncbi:hypothetical protein [Chryseobacterium sp. YIM B08800]|uniref:hypothetical protein n=1 Tax=Chryseobacterium sp. YIM B08800 TaxID=2984136 RepID=UPI0022403A3F|nr:hypothetical protein [Chryseobacterium sp. YIM B08800]
MSCRQDDESMAEEALRSSTKQNSTEESQRTNNDSTSVESIETDPPKNGTHWKVSGDSIKTPPRNPINNLKTDSLISFSPVIDEPKDPPKNGTHWKVKE